MHLIFLVFTSILSLARTQSCPPYQNMLDKAWLRFIYNKVQGIGDENSPNELIINMTYSECYQCEERRLTTIKASEPDANISYFLFPTAYSGTFFVYNQTIAYDPEEGTLITNNLLYTMPFDLKERGRYTILITDVYDKVSQAWDGLNIQLNTDEEGDDIYVPLYIAIVVLVVLVLVYNTVQFLMSSKGRNCLRKIFSNNDIEKLSSNEDNLTEKLIKVDSNYDEQSNKQLLLNNQKQANNKGKETQHRVQALDAFRGISLAIMLFVNSGAGNYVMFQQSVWNGLHLADLVFGWFVWIMGVSMAISFDAQQQKGTSKKAMLKKVLVRTAKHALLSLLITNVSRTSLDKLRFFGVLMRIAVSYLAVALIILYVPKNTKSTVEENKSKYRDIIVHVYEFIPVLVFLALWFGLTFGLPVPGCPTGYLGPGGLADYGKYKNCTGGAAGYIDYQLIGKSHLNQNPTSLGIYESMPFDSEGLLGTLTTIVMVYLGVMAGIVIIYHKTHKEIMKRWLIGALLLGVVSLILTGGSKNDGWIPINKNLWSLSYVTTLACFGLIILSLLYTLIDIKKIWRGVPFRAMGMNSIVLYVGSTILYPKFPFATELPQVDGCFNPTNDTHGWLLIRDIKNASLWVIIALWMDSDNFYIHL